MADTISHGKWSRLAAIRMKHRDRDLAALKSTGLAQLNAVTGHSKGGKAHLAFSDEPANLVAADPDKPLASASGYNYKHIKRILVYGDQASQLKLCGTIHSGGKGEKLSNQERSEAGWGRIEYVTLNNEAIRLSTWVAQPGKDKDSDVNDKALTRGRITTVMSCEAAMVMDYDNAQGKGGTTTPVGHSNGVSAVTDNRDMTSLMFDTFAEVWQLDADDMLSMPVLSCYREPGYHTLSPRGMVLAAGLPGQRPHKNWGWLSDNLFPTEKLMNMYHHMALAFLQVAEATRRRKTSDKPDSTVERMMTGTDYQTRMVSGGVTYRHDLYQVSMNMLRGLLRQVSAGVGGAGAEVLDMTTLLFEDTKPEEDVFRYNGVFAASSLNLGRVAQMLNPSNPEAAARELLNFMIKCRDLGLSATVSIRGTHSYERACSVHAMAWSFLGLSRQMAPQKAEIFAGLLPFISLIMPAVDSIREEFQKMDGIENLRGWAKGMRETDAVFYMTRDVTTHLPLPALSDATLADYKMLTGAHAKGVEELADCIRHICGSYLIKKGRKAATAEEEKFYKLLSPDVSSTDEVTATDEFEAPMADIKSAIVLSLGRHEAGARAFTTQDVQRALDEISTVRDVLRLKATLAAEPSKKKSIEEQIESLTKEFEGRQAEFEGVTSSSKSSSLVTPPAVAAYVAQGKPSVAKPADVAGTSTTPKGDKKDGGDDSWGQLAPPAVAAWDPVSKTTPWGSAIPSSLTSAVMGHVAIEGVEKWYSVVGDDVTNMTESDRTLATTVLVGEDAARGLAYYAALENGVWHLGMGKRVHFAAGVAQLEKGEDACAGTKAVIGKKLHHPAHRKRDEFLDLIYKAC